MVGALVAFGDTVTHSKVAMKIFVQIPCLNEEETLPLVLATIPHHIEGVDQVEILVVDDGSTDRTVEVARRLGVHHVLCHTGTQGLARSFRDGIDYALRQGADIVVNTDGDNQYPQERIADLVTPLLRGEADIAIGNRQTATIAHFSPFKKTMQSIVYAATQTHNCRYRYVEYLYLYELTSPKPNIFTVPIVVLGGELLGCLPLNLRFAGSNLAEGDGFLRAIKIRKTPSVEGEVKPSAPCRNISRHVKNPCGV